MKYTREERVKSAREMLNEARGLIQRLNRLGQNSDFVFLTAQQQSFLDDTVNQTFLPPKGVDGVLDNLYRQGEVRGFQRAMNVITLLISGAEEIVAQYKHLDENEED